MCEHVGCSSIFCILPARVLINIAQNGNEDQRSFALRALSLDHSLRTSRLTFSLLGGLQVSHESLTAAPPQKQRLIYDTQQSQTLPGNLVRSEGGAAVADVSVNQAYDGSGIHVRFLLRSLSTQLD